MRKVFGLLTLSAAMLLTSCSPSSTIEGTVRNVTEHTITITTEDNANVTFSTRGAKMHCGAGIHRGSPVTIDFKESIADGFGNATRVEAPERYNLLVGRWVAHCEQEPEAVHGFDLLPGGNVVEIGDHSIIYNRWRLDGDTLSLAESDENLDEEIFDLVHHWTIEHLDRSTLTLYGYDQRWSFARSERQ